MDGILFSNRVAVSGGLWRPPAVPAGPGPLGGARRGELRSNRLHRGEQTQRFYPHRCLHPLDRGNADQRFLPALIRRLKSALTANISSGLFMVCLLIATETFICLRGNQPRVIWRPAMRKNCFLMLHIYRKCCAKLCAICVNKTGSKKSYYLNFCIFLFSVLFTGV